MTIGAAVAVPMALLAIGTPTAGATAAPAGLTAAKLTVHRVGSTATLGTSSGGGELRPPDADSVAQVDKAVQNRSPHTRAKAMRTTTSLSGITPTQTLSVANAATGWQGINHFQQRTADGGNQWSLVPPDQALCAGDGQVVEAVNNAVRVFDTSGTALTDVVSNNQFFWHDHEVVRNADGTVTASIHQVGDPTCVYDAGVDRFFYIVYDAVSDTSANPTGPSYIDIAVSPVGTALGSWSIYQLDTTDDGTDGTPSHPNCPCFADYPHLGTDANGVYITTNEYPTFGAGYDGANVYAIDKQALAAGSAAIPAAMFNTARTDLYQGVLYDGFTIAPAVSSGTAYAPNTMYFLSSDAWSGDNPIVSRQILQWTIANTALIHTNPSALQLTHTAVASNAYYPPPASDQRPGPTPLADCLNTTGCAKLLLGTPDKYKEYEFALDSSDSRMLQAAYAHGQVWGALDTAVDVGGVTKAGVGYYVVNPTSSTMTKQGTLAVAGNNISYPAIGVTSSGRAVMALSLIGQDYYPSAAYLTLDDRPGTAASTLQIAGAGAGPDDSFDGYRGYAYNRPRWGDYGAASVVNNTVWIASEYIAQSCTLAQFEAAPFGTCGNTRTALANWSTHISAVTVG
jgi:hypothetical protein